MKCEVSSDCLAALMVLDKTLEPYPEPFRMQPDVLFVVDFEVYQEFVLRMPEDFDLLYFPNQLLRQRMEEGDQSALLKAFYLDMALAVCKELHYAESYAASASSIRHTFGKNLSRKPPSWDSNADNSLRVASYRRGYPLPEEFRKENMRHWKYACSLFKDASSSNPTFWAVE